MENEKTPVETKVENAGTQQDNAQPIKVDEVDYEAVLKSKDEEIAKISAERENYKKGLLKAKGKIADDDGDGQPDLEELVDRKVTERLLDTQLAKAQQEKDALITKLLKENKEAKVALQNKSQISNSAVGGSDQTVDVKVEQWTAEQLNYFKQNGLDPDKVMANLKALKEKNK
jgi:hypothetical protein